MCQWFIGGLEIISTVGFIQLKNYELKIFMLFQLYSDDLFLFIYFILDE